MAVQLAATLLAVLAATAPTADTLSADSAVALARRANPMLQAARHRAEAAAERVTLAGALPDPTIEFGLMNRPIRGLGVEEPMTMNTVGVTQTFPWPGKLGFGQSQSRDLARAGSLDADEAEAQLIAAVKRVYYRIAYVDRALQVMAQTRDLLGDLTQVATRMYSVGVAIQQDVLQAQVAVARMGEDITVMEQERVAMAARLNALLGRAATVAVPAVELSDGLDSLPTADALMEVAGQHRPALRAAGARVAAAEAGYRLARRELYPDVMVSAQYGQRPEFDDMATLMVGVSLPIWAGKRQLALRRETEAMRAMQEAEAINLHNETYAQLTELRAAATRARSLRQLYDTAILPQARAAVEAALAAYRVGSVDFLSLIENEMTVNRYEIERYRLTAEYHTLRAELSALLGVGGQP